MNEQGLTILAIDDHQDNLITLQAVVGDALPGARVLTALDGWRGMDLARTHDPDVILLDIVMPGMDGFEVCRRLKSDETLRHIPVVFLTALRTDRQSRVQALEAGAEGFLTKPLEQAELTAQIRAMAKIKAAHESKRLESKRLAVQVAQRTLDLEHELGQRIQAESSLRQANLELEQSREAALRLLEGLKTEMKAREESQAALKLSEEKYRGIFETIQDVYYEAALDGTILELSPSVERLTKFQRQELLGMPVGRLYANPEQRQVVLERLANQRRINDMEVDFKDKDGRVVPCSLSAVLVANEQGEPFKICGVLRDVSERRRAGEELRASVARLRSIFEQAAVGMSLLSPDGLWLQVNQRLCDILGYSRQELMSLTFRDLTHPEHLQEDLFRVARLIKGELRGDAWDKRYIRKDGQVIWVRLTTSMIRGEDGQPQYFVTVTEDITERKKAAEDLQRSQAFNASIIASSADCIKVLDLEGRLKYMSLSGLQMMGIADFAIFQDMAYEDFWQQSDQEVVRRALDTAREGGQGRFQGFCPTIDGQPKWWDVTVTPILGAGGRAERLLAVSRDISDRRQADEALRQSEQKYRNLFDNAQVGMFRSKLDGSAVLDVNDYFLAASGYSREELVGAPSGKLWADPGQRDEMASLLERDGQLNDFPCLLRTKSGQVRHLLVSFRLLREEGILEGSFQDITERKKAEEALRQSEEHLRNIFEQAAVGMSLLTPQGAWIQVNQRLCDILGYSREELMRLGFRDLTHLDDQAADEERLRRTDANVFQGGAFEKRYLHKDGRVIWARVTTRVVRDPDGKPRHMVAVTEDITERKRAEQELRQSEEKYRSLFDNAEVGMFRTKLDGSEILDMNDKYLAIVGYTRQEMLGSPSSVYWVDQRQRQELVRRLQAEGHVRDFEGAILNKEGQVRLCVMSMRLYPEQGILEGSIQDITERKQAEEDLRRSEELLRLVTDHIYDWEYWISPDLRLLFVSPSSYSVTGYQSQEFMDDPGLLERVIHPRDKELWRSHVEQYRLGEGFKLHGPGIEFRILAKNGQEIWISHRCRPVFGNDGNFLGRRVSNRDITKSKQVEIERAQLEAQLRQAQKMEAIGTLAGGIAHDFNNILAAVLGFAEIARDDAQNGRVNSTDLDQIIGSAQRARDLVHKILAFSRKKEPDLKPLSLSKAVLAAQSILKSTLPKMIRIETKLAEDLPPVLADPTQIEQVLLNLASNAQDAMAEVGQLLIETQGVTLDHEYCRQHLEVRPGDYVLLTVSDTGMGMDEKTREHIFEPFYTTKDIGKGTGLGLSSVYGIVKNHGGHIHCYSEPGQGTAFKIYLPSHRAAHAPQLEPSPVDEEALTGKERILLVDDEEALREYGQRVLKGKGYKVLTAQSGEEALELYRQKGHELDLVLMDLGMPGMGGHKALKEILALSPRARVVITSGYSAGAQVKQSLDSGAVGYVAKPFRRQELLTTIREVLDAGAK